MVTKSIYSYGKFPLASVVDYRNPIAPELLRKAGIERVFILFGIPLRSVDGRLIFDPEIKPELAKLFKLYGPYGIKVIVGSHYYANPPEGMESVDFRGRKIQIGCFNNEKFLNWMSETIKEIARQFSDEEAFDGFMFDDGVHVRVDCCYCDVCRQLFKERFAIDPPPFNPPMGKGAVDSSDPRLLWDAFHQEAYGRYLRTQATAAKSISKKFFLATIPSDSYFCGRQLNMEILPNDTSVFHNARLQRIDRIQVKHWHIFQSFPFLRVVADGDGRQRFGVGLHLTTPSPAIIMHHEGPFIEGVDRQQFLSPAEISRQMRTTIAEGADAISFWERFPCYSGTFPAIGQVIRDIRKIQQLINERETFPARIGLLYSTTTEILQQPWTTNTLERWKHLHSFESTAYALTRASIQFRIILENEVSKELVSNFDVVILTGVTNLDKSVVEVLEEGITAGTVKVLVDPISLPIRGGKICEFDSNLWFQKQLEGYRQLRYLDQQAAEIKQAVFRLLDYTGLQPAVISDGSCFARFFHTPEGSLLIFAVNWDIENEALAKVDFQEPYVVSDMVSGKELGSGKTIELKIDPAGWRVIRCRLDE